MRSLKLTSLLLGFGLLALLAAEREAVGRSKRKNKHAHRHGHSHGEEKEEARDSHAGHGHAHGSGSKFSFGLGLSLTQSLGDEKAGEGGGGGESHGHSHGLTDDELALDEGHSHGGGEAGASDSESSGPSTEIALIGGYQLTKRLGLNLGLGFIPSEGVGDPSLGVAYSMPLQRNSSLGSSFSATAPLSAASRDIYKITTLTAGVGPTMTRGKFTLGGRAQVSMTYYSKTIVVEREEDADHDHALRDFALQEGANHEEHEVAVPEAGTGDREFNRYGLSSNLGYRLAQRVSLGFGLGLAFVTHQFGPQTVETNATIVQGSYTWNAITGTLGLTTFAEGESIKAPTSPGLTAGVFYLYE